MKEMTMLDLATIDLAYLAAALEDHSVESSWWFDPEAGTVESWPEYSSSEDEEHPADRGFVRIEPTPSAEGYRDMEEFIERVSDPRARDLLWRAIGGRGAFRRFKDTLFEFPELRARWFAFHDARTERRAIWWLADHGVIDAELAEREISARPDPEPAEPGRPVDSDEVARAVAEDLRSLYGARLRRVILFGSRARQDAHPDSDIDLLVVLDRMDSAWEELRRMEPILWRRSYDDDVVVTATPIAHADLEAGTRPLVLRALAEGRDVA
jgi:predicted nucleotidyltransferase